MAFVAEGSQAFLSGNDDDDENLAALDSMTTSGSAFMSQQLPSGGGSGGGMTAPTTEGGGELGESLFDRIRRRTEEQQRQQKQEQQTTATAPSAFVSQQPSAESSMELGLEREPSDGIPPPVPPTTTNAGNAFDAAVNSVENRSSNNTAENTYSFTATTGEDFSFQPTAAPAVPTYGPSRNDPSYYSGANNSQQYPASFQEKAAMALNDAGSTISSLFGKGMAGASTLVSSAQERISGGSGGGARGGYNNSFLLREDSMEQGIGSNNMMQQPPPPPSQPAASQMSQSEAVAGTSYSMIAYAKTFCEDLYGFLKQLPPVGKAGVVVVLLVLWLLMRG